MDVTTICFCLCDNKVLLAMKKRGFGAGKWNGYGGKVGEREAVRRAAVREIKEESGLAVEEKDLEQVAFIKFYFDRVLILESYVFLIRKWQGGPKETEEMRPSWFPVSDLPFEKMWLADRYWVPLVLEGKKLKADVYYNHDGSELKDFICQEREFD